MNIEVVRYCLNLLSNVNVQIDVVRKYAEIISNTMFNLYFNWRKANDKKEISEADAIAQCILQIMTCKIQSFLKLSEGITVIPQNKSFMVLDIPSLIAIIRSMYELVFVFHNLYAEQESEEEKKIILYLWKIRGLNNRQGLSNVPEEYRNQEEFERMQIEKLREKIRNIVNELNVSVEVKQQIENVIKSSSTNIKGYKFEKDNDGKIVRFKDFRMEDNADGLLSLDEYINVYRLWSVHTHPSYLGVLQFGRMYNQGSEKQFLSTLLITTCKLACRMIKDFSEGIDGAREIYQSFSDEEKEINKIFV